MSGRMPPYDTAPTNWGEPLAGYAQTCSVLTPVVVATAQSLAQPATVNGDVTYVTPGLCDTTLPAQYVGSPAMEMSGGNRRSDLNE